MQLWPILGASLLCCRNSPNQTISLCHALHAVLQGKGDAAVASSEAVGTSALGPAAGADAGAASSNADAMAGTELESMPSQ